jgi:cytochrome c peroxidase
MQKPGRRLKTLCMIVLLSGLAGGIAGCDSGGSGPGLFARNPTDTTPGNGTPVDETPGDGQPQGTPVPTAPVGLPALAGAAAGSAGFNVIASPGMILPAVTVSPVPQPTGGNIIDQDAAIRLGKALFWDTQVGSDGQMACASCHFRAGADNRTTNTIHPGPDALFQQVPGPGALFPLATFNPAVVDDVVGSSGVISLLFGGISSDLSDPVDICTPLVPTDPAQALLANAGERLVTGRNTPPAIGAVFFLDNFWDGRASQNFNGLNPLGDGTAIAGISSLASQSVGPPLSDVEMSCAGRTWNGPNSLGAKMVPRTPLANQMVHPDDSVLGPLANPAGNGLDCGFADRMCTYADLIAAAFGTNGLSGQAAVDSYIDNFSSIWGQAVQAYEATLVPDRTPYDLGTLTPNQVAGLDAFRNRAPCGNCHVEPEFSDATVRAINANGGPGVQKLVAGLPGGDQGFHNIGASLTAADRGRAASPGGTYHVSNFNEGAFKTPSLRNVKLTAPYMHNGSIASIPDVIRFYNGQNQVANLEINPDAQNGVGGGAEAELADFLLNGLTDCRVENELAPFDHPALTIPDGQALPAVGRTGNGAICP